MGKAPKLLRILIHPNFITSPWIMELEAKGHIIVATLEHGDSLWDFDLILAPQACRWLPGMEFYLDEVIKGARKIKYPGKIKP